MDPKYIQRFHEINEPGCPVGYVGEKRRISIKSSKRKWIIVEDSLLAKPTHTHPFGSSLENRFTFTCVLVFMVWCS
mgnify:CR=1 FL=1